MACEAQFHWYGQAVNINPCLLNLVVRIYELLLTIEVFPPEEDVASMQASYEIEEVEGHSHYVDGRLTANVAKLDAVLSQVVTELPGV